MQTATTKLKRAIYREQLSTLNVLDELIELDRTKAYLKVSSSLFHFLTNELRYSEGAAMRRIHAARLIAKFSNVRELLRTRQVSLCTLSMIARECLTSGKDELLHAIIGKSKREVEAILAFRKADTGKSPLREQVRVIAAPQPHELSNIKSSASGGTVTTTQASESSEEGAFSPPPLQPAPMYRMSFTASSEVYERYQEVVAGMSHKIGTATDQVVLVFEAGLELLQKELRKKRGQGTVEKSVAVTSTKNSRYVPAALKRNVFTKAGCKCEYRFEDGTRCSSDYQLEVDHIVPYALGGKTKEDNLRVVCRNHNQFLAKEAGLVR